MEQIASKGRYLAIALAHLYLFCMWSCRPAHGKLYSGVLYQRMRIYNAAASAYGNTPFFFDQKFLVKDSAIVAIVQIVSYRSEHGQLVNVSYPVIYFTLIDLPSKTFYDFSSFSDTASILEAYRPDSTGAAMGGWYLFMKHPKLYTGETLALADTTIRGRKLKRVKGSRTIAIPSDELYTPDEIVMYMDCSSDGRVLHHPNSITEDNDCPVVMVESFRNGQPLNYNIFDYSREALTREQSRVIDAWLSRVRGKKRLSP